MGLCWIKLIQICTKYQLNVTDDQSKVTKNQSFLSASCWWILTVPANNRTNVAVSVSGVTVVGVLTKVYTC